jgi:hypothetical protein
MKRLSCVLLLLAAAGLHAQEPFDVDDPDWMSEDMASTRWIVLGDFNGDGWVSETGEASKGDGQRKVFHLEHFPAREVSEVRVDGRVLGLDEYCEDPYTGWIALGEAPAYGMIVEVDYTWSNRLDLFSGNESTLTIPANDVVYYNEGDGLSKVPDWTSRLDEDTDSCVAGDLDSDGDLDMICGGEYYTRVYYNDGSGLEETPSWSHQHYYNPVYKSVDLGDYNDDGYPDLAVADPWAGGFVIYTNEGGVLTEDPLLIPQPGATSAAWGDYDADGDLDLAVTCYILGEGAYTWVHENVNGVIQTTPVWQNDPPKAKCSVAAWGDANEDGYLDLFKGLSGAGLDEDRYSDIFYGDGSGLPTAPSWESQHYAFVHTCSFQDVNLDGHVDMTQAAGSHVEIYFWKDDGLETDPASLDTDLWLYVWTAELGDLNNDGAPDLVVGTLAGMGDETGLPNLAFYNRMGVGLEDADIFAGIHDEGVLVGWEITGDTPAIVSVLRSAGDGEPVAISGSLPGSAVRWLDTEAYDASDKGLKPLVYWLETVEEDGTTRRFGPSEPVTFPENAREFTLSVYPSPASDSLTIDYTLPEGGRVTIALYDLSGRRIVTLLDENTTPGRHETNRDTSDLLPGVYLARLSTDAGTLVKRLVITR